MARSLRRTYSIALGFCLALLTVVLSPAAVTGRAASVPAPPTIDAIAIGNQPLAKTKVTTGLFSTTSASELLLAFVAADDPAGIGTTVTSVTGAGLTWTLVKRTNVQRGPAEIWRAFAPAPLAGVSVSANISQAANAAIAVVTFTGVDASGTGGSAAIGATASGTSSAGAPTARLVTTRDNSWVFGVGNDFDRAIARTLGPNQTLVHQFLAPVGDTYWVQRASAPTAVTGTSVTINDVAPAADRFNLSLVEVLPASGSAPAPDTSAPTVSITGPSNGATVSGAVVSVSAQAGDNVAVAGVQVKVDGVNLGGELTAAPYSRTWNTTTVGDGPHVLSAVARDAAGNSATASVSVTVNNADRVAPAVSISAPIGGATVSGNITIAATASDNIAVAGVQVLLDGSAFGAELTTAPYAVAWDTTAAANRAYTLAARARDAAGNTATSAIVSVTVSNVGTPPPPPGPIATLPLVQASSLVYQGAFRVPVGTVGSSTFGYGGTALAFNSARNSLFMVGHDWDQDVAEITIPAVRTGAMGGLARATVLQPFADVTEGRMGSIGTGTAKVGGLIPYHGQLYLSAYLYYDGTGGQSESHFVANPDFTVHGEVRGPFKVGSVGAGFVDGYFGEVPEAWQASLGGPVLNGQCCLSIITRTSFGPAVFAIDPAQIGVASPVPAAPLVYYPTAHPLAPGDTTSSLFNLATQIRGVVFPEGSRSVLFFGRHGTGPYCYGPGTSDPSLAGQPADGGVDTWCYDPDSSSKGTHAFPYSYYVWAYDANDLAAVKAGQKQPWGVTPYATWPVPLPYSSAGSATLNGAAYDPATGRLFLSQAYGDAEYPIVHVFKIQLQ